MRRPRWIAAAWMALGLYAGLAGAALAQPAPDAGFDAAQREAIIGILREALRQDPTILRDALRQNPLVLRDAVEALQRAERNERETAQRAAIAQNAEALRGEPGDPVRGNPQGTVTVVEFFDARCPYCKQMHPQMAELLRRNRDVRLVMKDLPVLGPSSMQAARALLAAHRQGRYEALYDALMRLREEPTEAVLRREAERVGLDWARLRRDMDDPAIQRRLEANLRLAQELRIEGTPAIVVGDMLIPGAVDMATLERLVAEHRSGRPR